MTWIATISYERAAGRLRRLYDRIRAPGGQIDNIMAAHALRPHTMEGHMALYKHVLHHGANTLPKWLLEAAGLYVSLLNRCTYCVEHHFAGLSRLLGDEAHAAEIRSALEADDPAAVFGDKERAAMAYARTLTLGPAELGEHHIEALRAAGFEDGEILELNQVCAYFAYANRTALGLGVTTDGETLGLSPGDSDDPDNWAHG